MSDGPAGDGVPAQDVADGGGAHNDAVRAAVEAWANEPGWPPLIDVLRGCLFGELLLDITGSDLELVEGRAAPGAQITVRGGTGPDGRPALAAFTSHAEIALGHEPGTRTESLVQPAAGVLELCRTQDSAWLAIDPHSAACHVPADLIAFTLDSPRNDAVRAALEPGAGPGALHAALAEDGPLLLAVRDEGREPGELAEDTRLAVRTSEAPDGQGVALLAFTSTPELAARAGGEPMVTLTVREVADTVTRSGHAGVLINPAGPWAFVPAADLAAIAGAGG